MVITTDQLKRRFPRLLTKFGSSELDILLGVLKPTEASPGEVLYRCGELSDALYLVWEGKLALSLQVADQDVFLGYIGPGQYSGVTAVIDPGPALITVTVVEPSILLRLRHQELADLRTIQPRLVNLLLRALSLELVEWLRAYETYMRERTRPEDIQDFFRMSGYLVGIGSKEQ